jgi:DNA primase
VFDKSSNLFGLNIAKKSKSKTFIMVEGYMDVITLHQHGIDTAVASLGTAFTEGQAKLLKRYAEEVVLCYDGDEAGKKAANKAVDILSANDIKTKVISLSGAKDPDEFCKKNGVEAFKMVISDAKTPLLYKIGILKTKYDVSIPDKKIDFLKEAAKEIANLPGAIDREIYAKEISAEYNVSFDSFNLMVKREYSALKNKNEKKMRLDAVNELKQRAIVAGGESKFNKEAKNKLLNIMFYSREAYKEVVQTFDFELWGDDFYRCIAEKIKEYREKSNADIKESEFILEFPFEKTGELSEILSLNTNFDNDILGVKQLIAKIKENARRAEIVGSGDLNKARELLAERGKKLKGGS